MNQFYLPKSKQPCTPLPSQAAQHPWPVGYVRVIIPRDRPTKKGKLCEITIVRADSIKKMVNNIALPRGQWINLTQ